MSEPGAFQETQAPGGSLAEADRWLILGPSGGGKSRLALELGAALTLPVIHLDRHFWRPGWVETDRAEWREKVAELVSGEAWVIDGNFSGTLDLRLARAEAAILLDPSVATCLHGIYQRKLTYGAATRPDMAKGCPEKWPDRRFLWWVASYKWLSRPKVLGMMAEAPHVHFRHLMSRHEAHALVEGLRRYPRKTGPASGRRQAARQDPDFSGIDLTPG